MNNVEHLLQATRSMDAAWDGARSRRVLEGALKSRATRARRQRFIGVACAASAALFVLGIRSFATPQMQAQSFENNESANLSNSGMQTNGDALNTGGAISMNADLFADGGHEAD